MKPLEVKFDLFSLLDEITLLSPKDLGVDRLIILCEKDEPNDEKTSAVLIAGKNVLDVSSLLYRSMEKEIQLSAAVAIASATLLAESKKDKK